ACARWCRSRPGVLCRLYGDRGAVRVTPLLEVTVNIDAATITAFFVGVVACFSAYQSYKARVTGQDIAAARGVISETKEVVDQTHVIVNSQRSEMMALIEDMRGESAA